VLFGQGSASTSNAWVTFNGYFLSTFKDFKKGRQDDSGKAFEAIINLSWNYIDPEHEMVTVRKLAVRSECPQCASGSNTEPSSSPFVVYAGNDEIDAEIGMELLNQDQCEILCDKCEGPILQSSNFLGCPEILFLVGTCGSKFLQPLSRGFSIPMSPREVHYQMIGVALHSGTTAGGHYVSLVNLGNKWYSCSDDTSNEVSLDHYARNNYHDIQLIVCKRDLERK